MVKPQSSGHPQRHVRHPAQVRLPWPSELTDAYIRDFKPVQQANQLVPPTTSAQQESESPPAQSHPRDPRNYTPLGGADDRLASREAQSPSTASRQEKKKKSPRLDNAKRRRICQYFKDNPDANQKEIGAKFAVDRSTVSKILKERAKWLSIPVAPSTASNPSASQPRKQEEDPRRRDNSRLSSRSLLRDSRQNVEREPGMPDPSRASNPGNSSLNLVQRQRELKPEALRALQAAAGLENGHARLLPRIDPALLTSTQEYSQNAFLLESDSSCAMSRNPSMNAAPSEYSFTDLFPSYERASQDQFYDDLSGIEWPFDANALDYAVSTPPQGNIIPPTESDQFSAFAYSENYPDSAPSSYMLSSGNGVPSSGFSPGNSNIQDNATSALYQSQDYDLNYNQSVPRASSHHSQNALNEPIYDSATATLDSYIESILCQRDSLEWGTHP